MRLADLVLSGFAAALFSTGAMAADVTYTFSTGAALDHGGSNDTNPATRAASQATANSLATFLSGSSVSGSFVYDASSPVTAMGGALNGLGDVYSTVAQPNGSFHSSFNALAGSVNGASAGTFTFTDPRGFTIVGNDASPGPCVPPCTPPLVDLFQFQAESMASSGTHNIVPFTITVSGNSYRLFNARFIWQEGQVVSPNPTPGTPPTPDFLTSNALLSTPPSFYGRLSLDFVNTLSPGGIQYFVFYDGVSAIPEPQTYALIMAGLGLLVFVARRKQQLVAIAR